ncbi:MAG: aldose 1-epimerase [Alphaproteobacteria bacterium]|nr:aldose 1-epimerase [Alphaproteobacteria bacterium]MBV9370150.1 aldose 1-epimerase [Alphaproteobacteria bacterium]MBV9901490.1 aldose 1-epimerase [Alphaproteobacteria bacterium]
MTDARLLNLSNGALTLVLAPSRGGSIARFDYRSTDGAAIPLLRGSEDPAGGAILDHASFPLVPYVNRIRGGRFPFRGREVRLAPNLPGDPSPLHGQGWLAPWEVDGASSTAAVLSYRHPAGEWPWAYDAAQHFSLDPGGFTAILSCTNRSAEPMPCGLGHHPYFPCTAETVLDTGVADVWTVDDKVLPVERIAAEGRYDLRNRRICGQGLDNGFSGWLGLARIETPGAPVRIELSSPEAAFFQVYSPESGGLFVAEPVTHANAALNEPEETWPELGLRVLDPGETMSLTMRLEVVPAPR